MGGRLGEEQLKKDNLPTAGIIGVISGGPAGGDSMTPSRNNEATVISTTISNFWVEKILIDSGSSTDILFYKAFFQMGIDNVRLTLVNTPLTSFSGDIVEPLEEAILPVSLGSHAKRAIASSFQMKIKFPTLNEIEEEIGERKQARECYANTLKKPITASSMKSKEDDKFPSQKRLQKTTLGKSQEKTPPPPQEEAEKEP
ncbi:UNVERIFIED_CONTAM: hypothetical protein Sangu_2904600 [Sesamum angustifolium]|uniref:Uncharacterized protein n=1 Tax=Sesamum angustifolium TaxID=2727405 RepID=A0AAW2ILY6_9LAMI